MAVLFFLNRPVPSSFLFLLPLHHDYYLLLFILCDYFGFLQTLYSVPSHSSSVK